MPQVEQLDLAVGDILIVEGVVALTLAEQLRSSIRDFTWKLMKHNGKRA
ncbi:hypothetical protein ACTMU2_39180 [Cupriavidus basilensis]